MTEAKAHPITAVGGDGATRLLSLVGRSAPPHRPVGELLRRWYAASGTDLLFDEWADPATDALAAAFAPVAEWPVVEQAVVAFAQARAGADHDVHAVSADLAALVRLAWPVGRGTWGDVVDPVGLLALALSAWAEERTASACHGDCLDPLTGLVAAHYLRMRLRELHGQCRSLDISPAATFGAVVVDLDLTGVPAPDAVGARVAVARLFAARFRAGETVAATGPTRMVAVMPAYGLDRAVHDVTADLAECSPLDGVGVTVERLAFADDGEATFRRLTGSPAGA